MSLLAPGPIPKGMRPFTEEEAGRATYFFGSAPWGGPDFRDNITPEYCDPPPKVNAKGGVDYEGWRCVFSAVINEGGSARALARA